MRFEMKKLIERMSDYFFIVKYYVRIIRAILFDRDSRPWSSGQ